MFRFFLLLSFLLLSCTRFEDGPMPVYSQKDMGDRKEGFFYVGELNYGAPILSYGDTLSIYLDSIWSFSNCSLSDIVLEKSIIDDTLLTIRPRIELAWNDKDCASPLFRPETLLLIPMQNFNKIKKVSLLNTGHEEIDTTIIRYGHYETKTDTLYLDFLFEDPYALPLRSSENASFFMEVDSIETQDLYWKLLPYRCEKINDSCDLKLDTLLPNHSWSPKDTISIPLIKSCENSKKTYCLEKDWAVDSAQIQDKMSIEVQVDTTWFTSFYYIEPIDSCQQLTQLKKLSEFYYGGHSIIEKTLFIFDPSKTKCSSKKASSWIIYDLMKQKSIQEADKANKIVAHWVLAPIAPSYKKEDNQ